MTEGTLVDLAVETLDLNTPEADEQYNTMLRKLRYYQGQIDDIAAVAAAEIAIVKGRHDHKLTLWEPFLKAYTRAHLKDKTNPETGETKLGKTYRSIVAGAGGFFKKTPRKITFTQDLLKLASHWQLFEDKITAETRYAVTDPEALIAHLEAEKIEEGYEIVEADEYGKFDIGGKSAWSANAACSLITAALKGKATEENEEDE